MSLFKKIWKFLNKRKIKQMERESRKTNNLFTDNWTPTINEYEKQLSDLEAHKNALAIAVWNRENREKELIEKIREFKRKCGISNYTKYNNMYYGFGVISDNLFIKFNDEDENPLFFLWVDHHLFLDGIENRNELDYWIDSQINDIEKKLIK